ncbi:hypothetical protein V493_01509 [Pseudogymnoascus sp. VKM F-4281 (FW-2241)]|nr:hypothetical protein V493_01509 [Pseudogymnoascus sp. VKM F-4281 (FW-2241)]
MLASKWSFRHLAQTTALPTPRTTSRRSGIATGHHSHDAVVYFLQNVSADKANDDACPYYKQKEDQSAHTISQRLRQWKRIPPELVPLGIVVGIAVAFGAYSLGAKLMDKQMRLSRQNRGHD